MSAFDDHSTPPKDAKVEADQNPRGIANPGSLCYLITLLQHLAHIPAFKSHIIDVVYNTNPPFEFTTKYDDVMKQLASVMLHLGPLTTNASVEAVEVTPLYHSIQAALQKDINIDLPRDASEYFGELCKLLGLWFAQSSVQSHPVLMQKPSSLQYFQGSIQNIIEPMDVVDIDRYQKIIKTEHFNYLSLNISSGHLLGSFQQFQQAQHFPFKWKDPSHPNQYEAQPRMTKKCSLLHTLPPVLMLHLNRFSYSMKYKVKLKLHDFFEFPERFSLQLDEKMHNLNTKESYEYELRGVLVHIGETAYTGHYVSYVYNEENKSWWHCNDHEVTPAPNFVHEGMKELFGVKYSNNDEKEKEGDENKDKSSEDSSSSSSSSSSSDSDSEGDGGSKTEPRSAFILFYHLLS